MSSIAACGSSITTAVAERLVRFVDLSAQIDSLQPALGGAIEKVIQRGDFILGEDVELFEREFAAYCGIGQAVGTDSGLSALELALRVLGVGPGHEVITQANTFIATVGAVLAVGARPVLVDCDEAGVIDPKAVADAITPETRAIIPVHLFGRLCDVRAINAVAARGGIHVIEDACQAHGAILDGRRAGSFGVCAAFSFYPAKNLGAFGDGGMLMTDSMELANHTRILRNYGQRAKYDHVDLPLNRRLDTLQAAVLRIKLPHLDEWNAQRRSHADAYRQRLRDLPIGLPAEGPESPSPLWRGSGSGSHVYHLFVITANDRDALKADLASHGIETGIHYPLPVHLQPSLRALGYQRGAFPNAERLASNSLSLPMYPELPLEHLEAVTDAIQAHYR